MKLEDFIEKHGNVSVNEKELKEMLGIKDEKYFYPKEDAEYYLVDVRGEVDKRVNRDLHTGRKHFKNNELFRTREEAEEHARKQRFLLKMERDFLDNSDEIDWKDRKQTKRYVGYDHTTSSLVTGSIFTTQYNDFYTTNKEWLKEYIEKYEEEIKKYYLEIE